MPPRPSDWRWEETADDPTHRSPAADVCEEAARAACSHRHLDWWSGLAEPLAVLLVPSRGRLSVANEDLAAARARNDELQSQVDELQVYSDMAADVTSKRAALQAVLAGDVAWPSVLNDISSILPGEIWLRSMTASAGATEGATPAGTETAPVRISDQVAYGRIQFQGSSLSQPGVAKWLLSLDTVKEFDSVYLNDATETEATEAGGREVVDFDSTLELNAKAAAFHPFLEGLE